MRSNQVKLSTSNPLIPDTEALKVKAKTVAVISVSEYPIKPVPCRAGYFNRVKNANHQMTMSGKYLSIRRYRKIADMFKEAGLTEKYGPGIQRILRGFETYVLQMPRFEEITGGFRVTQFSNKLRLCTNRHSYESGNPREYRPSGDLPIRYGYGSHGPESPNI